MKHSCFINECKINLFRLVKLKKKNFNNSISGILKNLSLVDMYVYKFLKLPEFS